MAKIAVLVPRQDMADYAGQIAEETGIALHLVKVIETPAAVEEARSAVEGGATIVVARGLQAQLMIRNTNIPVIEIKLTGQELGLLVRKAKALAGKERPAIAFVGFQNFFSSMSFFEQLFDITLRIYYAECTEDLHRCVDRAGEDGADVIVGGDVVLLAAGEAGIPALFYEATEESVREALYIARRAAYAADMEKLFHAQTETILDTSAGGILKIDRSRVVTMSNRVVEELLNTRPGQLVGKAIGEVVPGLDEAVVGDILSGAQERLTISVRLGGTQLMAACAPIEVDGVIDGAIITFHRLISVSAQESANLRERYLHGYMARANFEQIIRSSKGMRRQVELARMYALSRSPVLIYGETGTEKELFAQAIHNNSSRRNQPYVSLGCFAGDEGAQHEALFGRQAAGDDSREGKGALLNANFGTLVLHDIEKLCERCQYELLQTIQTNALIRGNVDRAAMVDVRIIATGRTDLAHAVKGGGFRSDLYYALGALVLELPPLRGDAGQIRALAEGHIARFTEQYAKYVTLDQTAWSALELYEWGGNLLQLEAFCERLIVGAHKKKIDGGMVAALLAELYPEVLPGGGADKVMVLRHPEAVKIAQLLERHGGSRKAAAEELGVSPSTLWRRMRKYGVDARYGV